MGLLSTLALAAAALAPATARADDVYQLIIKKQEQKKSSQWSLSEWLETKNRMALMDMWLAFHTPTPYEFYFGGNLQFGQLDHGTAYKGGAAQIAAFATIFGLEYEHERSATKIDNALFHMRLFGLHNQTTNLTLHGGLRVRGEEGEYRSPVAGLTLTLYFTRYFGAEGLYRHFFNSNVNDEGNRITGDRFEAGGFIDFSFVRVYLDYYHESETATMTALQDSFPIRSGVLTGVRLFF